MAIGSYATIANVKKRLASSDSYSADDDAVLTSLCDAINGWIELKSLRVLAPVDSTTYLFDAGDWTENGSVLNIPAGIRAVASLKLAPATGQPLVLVPAVEYLLLPRTQHRQPGYPATRLLLHNAGGSASVSRAYSGYGIAELVGDFGWAAIPPEIRELAETAVVRAWHGRQAGQSDIVGSDENGAPIVSRFISSKDRETLKAYHPYGGVMIG